MQELLELLKQHQLTVSCAESFTGGFFANELTNLPGSSEVFAGGLVCYSKQSKIDILKVKASTISDYTTVSAQVAKEMALNCQQLFKSDICVSFTGNAGPSASDNDEVGLAFISILGKNYHKVVKINETDRSRQQFKLIAVKIAINEIIKYINVTFSDFFHE